MSGFYVASLCYLTGASCYFLCVAPEDIGINSESNQRPTYAEASVGKKGHLFYSLLFVFFICVHERSAGSIAKPSLKLWLMQSAEKKIALRCGCGGMLLRDDGSRQ